MARVSTPIAIDVEAVCPECDQGVVIAVDLITRLTVEDGETTLAVKSKAKAVHHLHGQTTLSQLDMDAVMDDVVDRVNAGELGPNVSARRGGFSPERGAEALDELNRDLDGEGES